MKPMKRMKKYMDSCCAGRNKKRGNILVPAACILSLAFCIGLMSSCSPPADSGGEVRKNPDIAQTPNINDVAVSENKSVYDFDDDDSVVTMYLTVRRGNDEDNTNHSWTDIISHSKYYYDELGVDKYKVEGLIQVGDENGPKAGELGYAETVPNATVQIRGQTTSRADQKSFKIRLMDNYNGGEWRGQRTISLNKHPYDSVRFRNKMSYDLIKTIPNMIGARTQFVHLYVRDLTDGAGSESKFEDYGLFTQVEQMNGRYLRNHGLDENGQFYKATMFEFYRYEDSIKLKEDETYDVKAFEQVMEIKGNDDHSKLIAMLDEVNNYSIPIEEVFSKYFDEENYFTWLAYQMMTGNTDTMSQNFYLYSPQMSDKWYFVSWDNDDAFTRGEDLMTDGADNFNYLQGLSNYWGVVLHQRVFKSETLRKKLDDKINEIKGILTEQKLTDMVNMYASVTRNYIYSYPDNMHAEYNQSVFDSILKTMPKEIEYNYQYYQLSLEKPMPFHYEFPEKFEQNFVFSWDSSYDFDNENISYTFELARDYKFNQIVSKQEGLMVPQAKTELLPPGQYFFRITATNESGYSQRAMEMFESDDGIKHYGVIRFYVNNDGEIEM